METPILIAVRSVGSQSALARAVEVSPQAVQQWVATGRVSHRKVIAVERATGVSRSLLRPDLYPDGIEVQKYGPPEIPPDLQAAAVMLKGLSGKFADEDAIAWFLHLPPKYREEIFPAYECITTGICIEELNRVQALMGGAKK